MAEDYTDREDEYEAEREAEIEEELERVDQESAQAEGDDDLGTQNAPREDAEDLEDLEENPEETEESTADE